jgi:poly(A) polymerase
VPEVPVRRELDKLIAANPEVRRLVGLARGIVVRLQEAGHEAYFVGGAVRDILRGHAFTEVDITTSAEPAHIRALFSRTIPIGEAFGVIAVLRRGIPFEVATFRSETGYTDGRHPDEVRIGTLAEDVLRRDFTINGLVLDPVRMVVIDLVDGISDLRERRLRAIGDPDARMNEDYLRTLRAVRFAACLEVDMDPATKAAVIGAAAGLERISRERIRNELDKLSRYKSLPKGLQLVGECGLAEQVFGVPVDDAHMEEAAAFLEALPYSPGLPEMLAATALAAEDLSLDVNSATPSADERARREAERLRLANADRKLLTEIFSLFPLLRAMPDARLGVRVESYRLAGFGAALHLERARRQRHGEAVDALDLMWQERLSLPPDRLAGKVPITGRDLIDAGFTTGPKMGAALRELSYLFVEGKMTSRAEALRWVEELLREH